MKRGRTSSDEGRRGDHEWRDDEDGAGRSSEMLLRRGSATRSSACCDLYTHAQIGPERSTEHADQESPAKSAGDQEDQREAGPSTSRSRSPSSSSSSSSSTSSRDSLFSSRAASPAPSPAHATSSSPSTAAHLYSHTCPPIPGMYFFPSLLSAELERELLAAIGREGYFSPSASGFGQSESAEGESEAAGAGRGAAAGEERNQAMLFGRARPLRVADGQEEDRWSTGLPAWADEIVAALSELLKERARASAEGESGTDVGSTMAALPQEVWEMLFPESSFSSPSHHGRPRPQSRQLILNRYHPPQGLSSHVDLPHRFADGILLCSLKAGIGMRFRPAPLPLPLPLSPAAAMEERSTSIGTGRLQEEAEDRRHTYHLYLPPRSVLVLSGEARWAWEHGIEESWGDWVEGDPEGEGESEGEGEGERTADRERGGGAKEEQAKGKEGKVKRATFIPRMERQSITIRFMKEGADCVGG